MRILITGGAGFIGSHLADSLVSRGDDVHVIDDLSTGRLANIQHLFQRPNFHFARASINDEVVLDRIVSGVEAILHMAGAVGVQLIVSQPVRTIETNIMGTEAVLKAALRYGCKTVIASTSEVYGKGSKVPFNEDDDVLLGATSRSRWCYAASKMVDEFLGLAYHKQYGLPVTIARFFNTVGPRQTGQYGMVVPRFVRQALLNEDITVYGQGTQSRCFCDVSDTVRAALGLLEHPGSIGRVFNIGSTEEITIAQLAEKIRRITDSGSKVVAIPYDQAYAKGFEDMRSRVPDISRIESLMGWRPALNLSQILERVRDHLSAEIQRNTSSGNEDVDGRKVR